jgi:hypothetical protein
VPPTPLPAPGVLKVLPGFGITFSGGKWIIIANCGGDVLPCSGTVTIKTSKGAKSGKGKKSKSTVLSRNLPYSMTPAESGGLFLEVEAKKAKSIKETIRRKHLKSVQVLLTPSGGQSTAYRMEITGKA